MSFRKTAKVTRDVKMEFTLYVDTILGLPTSKPGSDRAPRYFVKITRGDSIELKSMLTFAVSDVTRARDYIADLANVAPTVAKVEQQFAFISTLQKQGDFEYKHKMMQIQVVDEDFNVVFGGELDIAQFVDKETMIERQFEVMNQQEDKYVLFSLSGEPAAAAEAKRKANGDSRQPPSSPGATASPARDSKRESGRYGSRQAADDASKKQAAADDEDDEFNSIIESKSKVPPAKQSSKAAAAAPPPKQSQQPPPQDSGAKKSATSSPRAGSPVSNGNAPSSPNNQSKPTTAAQPSSGTGSPKREAAAAPPPASTKPAEQQSPKASSSPPRQNATPPPPPPPQQQQQQQQQQPANQNQNLQKTTSSSSLVYGGPVPQQKKENPPPASTSNSGTDSPRGPKVAGQGQASQERTSSPPPGPKIKPSPRNRDGGSSPVHSPQQRPSNQNQNQNQNQADEYDALVDNAVAEKKNDKGAAQKSSSPVRQGTSSPNKTAASAPPPNQQQSSTTSSTTNNNAGRSSPSGGNQAGTRAMSPNKSNTTTTTTTTSNTSNSNSNASQQRASPNRQAQAQPASTTQREASQGNSSARAISVNVDEDDDEPVRQIHLKGAPVRSDNSTSEVNRKMSTAIKKLEQVVHPTPPPARPKDSNGNNKNRGAESSDDEPDNMKDLKLEPHTKEDTKVVKGGANSKNSGSQQTTSSSAPPSKAPAANAGARNRGSLKPADFLSSTNNPVLQTVQSWIRDVKQSCLMAIPPSSSAASSRQSLSLAERKAPLPYSSQLVLHVLHTAHVSNGELSQFVGDFLLETLYRDVVRHSRHYGIWVRILLHVLDELLLYYYPPVEDLRELDLDEVREEQEYFKSSLGEIIREKDAKFTDLQQANGDHILFVMEQALHRGLSAPHLRSQARWELEETDEDREDRIFLHALIVVEVAAVLNQLTALASDRVEALLHIRSPMQFQRKYANLVDNDAMTDLTSSTTNFLFSVSQQRNPWISAVIRNDATGDPLAAIAASKKPLFTTELGSTGWLPTLLAELNALYITLSDPQPETPGNAANTLMRAHEGLGTKKASPRAHAYLTEVFKTLFFNINCALVNRMHIPTEEGDDSAALAETMSIKTAREAMTLKLAISALEQWLTDHQLYTECRKELLQLRQICDLFILPKSIFSDVRTRVEVCGLVPEEFMFHALLQFTPDDREITPDKVPDSLLDALASSLSLRRGIRVEEPKEKGKTKRTLREEVARRVRIPNADLVLPEFGLHHIDTLMGKYAEATGRVAKEAAAQESRAIQESLEWDVR